LRTTGSDAPVARQRVQRARRPRAENLLERRRIRDLEVLILELARVHDGPIRLAAGGNIEIAAHQRGGHFRRLLLRHPGLQALELRLEPAARPAQVRAEHVDQPHVRHAHLRHHDLPRVDVVGVRRVGHVARVGEDERMPAQNRHALAELVEPEVRPVGVQVVRRRQLLVDDARRVRRPVARAVVPVLAHFLQADQVDPAFADRAGDRREFRELVFLLPGVQVQRQDLERAVLRAVVQAAAVVPDDAALRAAFDGELHPVGVPQRQAGGPDGPAVAVGVARVAAAGPVPMVAPEIGRRGPPRVPAVRRPVHRHRFRFGVLPHRDLQRQRHQPIRQPRRTADHAHVRRLEHDDARIRVGLIILPVPAVPVRLPVVFQHRRELHVARDRRVLRQRHGRFRHPRLVAVWQRRAVFGRRFAPFAVLAAPADRHPLAEPDIAHAHGERQFLESALHRPGHHVLRVDHLERRRRHIRTL
jgi:hypothetical protein